MAAHLAILLLVGLLAGSAIGLSSSGETDLTIHEKATGTEVVQAVVDLIDRSCIFSDDKLLLRRLAYVASEDGKSQNTFPDSYYGGIWQVSEALFLTTKTGGSAHFKKILSEFDIDWNKVQWKDLLKPLHSGLAARMLIEMVSAEVPRSIVAQATFWVTHLSSGADVNTFISAIGQLQETCNVPKADILFVLDGSGSIGSSNFDMIKDFVENLVNDFNIGSNAVRVGLIKFSAKAKTEFGIGEYDTKSDVIDAVRDIKYEQGGTNTADALDLARTTFTDLDEQDPSQGPRKVPRIVIVLTDGKSNDPDATKKAANKVHAHSPELTVFAIAVTSNVDTDELKAIASDPDCMHLYYLSDFNEMEHFRRELVEQACKAPADIPAGSAVTGTVNTGMYIYYKVKVKTRSGVNIKIRMFSGEVKMYLHYGIQNPSQAIHKYKFLFNSYNSINGQNILVPPPVDPSQSSEVPLYMSMFGNGLGDKNWYYMAMQDAGFSHAGALKASGMLMLLAPLMYFLL